MNATGAPRFLFASTLALFATSSLVACGTSIKDPGTAPGSDSGGVSFDGSGLGDDGGVHITFDGSVDSPTTPVGGDGGVPCPPGTTCNASCPSGAKTTLSGTVLDPAGKNPLYNIVVYIPATTPDPLPKGASCNSCDALFSGTPIAVTSTDTSGKFTLTNVPATGAAVPLVVQVGKWRTQTTVKIDACASNTAGNLRLPGKHGPGADIPDIAVSTGSADSLECLLTRIGVDSSEYVAGSST
ncbi:MAG: carboxypeptidase regulatory-like domain-containing protein, partial [Polyangiales bacterium]